MQHRTSTYPLYNPRWEHDACGTGFLAQISGEASHQLVQTALEALTRLTHRGAQDADAETSDGAGLLTQIPGALLREELQARGIADPADLAVGMLFLPSQARSPADYLQSRQSYEKTLCEVGLVPSQLHWRNPPLDYTVLGARARATAPSIVQVLLTRPSHLNIEQYERSLYYARRLVEQRWQEAGINDAYVASLSRSTVVYKGLLAPNQLARFYLDLADPRYASAFAIFHQRYSTNTFPSWPLAQPLRLLAHNGEINTIQGNRNWMLAPEAGVVPCEAHEVVEKGRLGPGEMIAVALEHGVLLRNSEIKAALSQYQPYQQWLDTNLVHLADLPQQAAPSAAFDRETLFQRQQLAHYDRWLPGSKAFGAITQIAPLPVGLGTTYIDA